LCGLPVPFPGKGWNNFCFPQPTPFAAIGPSAVTNGHKIQSIMSTIKFEELNPDIHTCRSELQGDWMVWHCPHCPGYERRLNWRTGELRAARGGSNALHAGGADEEGVRQAFQQELPLN
jgi:hypothetical protein